MFDGEQLVEIKWNTSNYKKYIELGYEFTKMRDTLTIKAKHLFRTSKTNINVVCDYCGETYVTSYVVAVTNNPTDDHACSKCAPSKANKLRKAKFAEEKIAKVKEICDDAGYILLTDESQYTGACMYIDFICPIHGKQKMILDNLLRGHKCRKCSYINKKTHKLKKEDVVNVIESCNGNILLNPDDYKDSVERNLDILCSCGNVFRTSYSNYTRAGVNRCKKCSCRISSGELIVKQFLDENKINYVYEKRFYDCRDKKALPFDFYLPDYNICIEFDGPQHYRPTFSEESFVKTQIHDKIKDDYCLRNNIELLRIPFWNGSHICDIISAKLAIL